MQELTDLGSGFKLAMRGLEIRGAGNLMGAEQHGFIDAVGFEMYCQMLNDAVKQTRHEQVEIEIELLINTLRAGYRFAEFPSHERERAGGVMKSHAIRHGIPFFTKIFFEGLKYRFGK